jgi:hypothetical protein
MIVSAAKAGALIKATDSAAAATVDRIASFLDTGFLPGISRLFATAALGAPNIWRFIEPTVQQAVASSHAYRGKIALTSQWINQSA